MSNINLKGITSNEVIRIAILIVSLINAILQMMGFNTIPITNDDISNIISSLFLVITAFYNAYKNLNVSKPSQIVQYLIDAMKNGNVAIEQVEEITDRFKANEVGTDSTNEE